MSTLREQKNDRRLFRQLANALDEIFDNASALSEEGANRLMEMYPQLDFSMFFMADSVAESCRTLSSLISGEIAKATKEEQEVQ